MSIVELEPIYDSRKSFYGKAKVRLDGTRKILLSYGTEVAYISYDAATVISIDSPTTLRHIKEFLQQNGFQIGTKAAILKMYGKREEE